MAEKNMAIPNKNISIPNKEVANFPAAFDPEVRNMVRATRCFCLPDISRHHRAGCCEGAGIAYAMELADTEKLLEGTGKLHRHVKLKSTSDLDAAGLIGFLLVPTF